MTAPRMALSVIMPLSSDDARIAAALDALAGSDLPRAAWELIVVATDQPPASVDAAAARANVIVRLDPAHASGASYAYNRGAEVARAPVLVFLDGDVVVRPDTLRRIADAFADDGLAALVASVDPPPRSAGLAARYRTLIQEWVYQNCAGESEFFSSSASAVRTSTFFSAGELDEWQRNDASAAALGLRLRALGRRTELRSDIHVRYQGELHWPDAAPPLPILEPPPPWLETEASPHGETATSRYRARETALSRAVWLATACLICAAMYGSRVLAFAAAALGAAVVLVDAPMGAYLARLGGVGLAIVAIPMRLASLLVGGGRRVARTARARLLGEPRPAAGLEALTEVDVPGWPPTPARSHEFVPAIVTPSAATRDDAGHD
ncbi:MAG TPA: glycosyltransferase family 2 protein [Gemmatimonadaceae bacterium]|nr:glycosyltransferase family 2 protein [Gemmatimonadaceae bacterium]